MQKENLLGVQILPLNNNTIIVLLGFCKDVVDYDRVLCIGQSLQVGDQKANSTRHGNITLDNLHNATLLTE